MVTKEELIAEVSAAAQAERKEVERILDSLVKTIITKLKAGEQVHITNLGKFLVKDLKERKARNPRTGEVITASPKKHVLFHASTFLKEELNKTT
jgi:nucleoid DNA-binding protein